MAIEVDLIQIGHRIEAVRGKLSQAEFAGRLGVDRKTIGTWERGERLLDTRALLAIWSEFDAAPPWVLIGDGSGPSLSDDEQELLSLYRAASLPGKMAAVGALQGVAASAKSGQVFHGSVGQVVKTKKLDQTDISFFGGKTKK